MLISITRGMGPNLERCELTHLSRQPIDPVLAWEQHQEYEACLATHGCSILRLAPEPGCPDSVFVEDTAVVLDEVAIVARPGALSRRPETAAVTTALSSYRNLERIEEPGTLDGGDVLRLGRALYVGHSKRTNWAGIEQLAAIASRHGYTTNQVAVTGCLHLKSAVSQVAPEVILINRDWVEASAFARMEMIDVDPSEPFAANALLLETAVIYPAEWTATGHRLDSRGINLTTVAVSELAKAEGGVTCCSLVFRT